MNKTFIEIDKTLNKLPPGFTDQHVGQQLKNNYIRANLTFGITPDGKKIIIDAMYQHNKKNILTQFVVEKNGELITVKCSFRDKTNMKIRNIIENFIYVLDRYKEEK